MLVYKSGWKRLLYKVIFKHSSKWREVESHEFIKPERISEWNLSPGRRAAERSRDDPEEGAQRRS